LPQETSFENPESKNKKQKMSFENPKGEKKRLLKILRGNFFFLSQNPKVPILQI
jgi:hypothetical protein